MTQQSQTQNTSRPQISREEAAKRMPVFTMAPETILIKVLAMGPLPGLRKIERDQGAITAEHTREAEARGADAYAYGRDVPDSGYCLFQKEEQVFAATLIVQMEAAGFVYTGGHWYQDARGKGPVNVLTFSRHPSAKKVDMPAVLRTALSELRFNNGTVWLNMKQRDDGSRFRLDTVNLAKGVKASHASGRHFRMEGNTYRLV